ncbi:MAG: hypothetical protein WBP38_08680, partial [Hyphomicrobium sp.]
CSAEVPLEASVADWAAKVQHEHSRRATGAAGEGRSHRNYSPATKLYWSPPENSGKFWISIDE